MNQYHPHAVEGYFCGTPPAGATLMKASFFFCGDGLDFDTFRRRFGFSGKHTRKKEVLTDDNTPYLLLLRINRGDNLCANAGSCPLCFSYK